MSNRFIIIMTAANRVGILAAVSRAISDLGGDLVQASQTVVHGFFTMILAADFPENHSQDVIREHLAAVGEPFHIELQVRSPDEVGVPADDEPVSGRRLYNLRIGGRNQPGALQKLSTVIAMMRIDITALEAVKTNDTEFEMVLKIAVPADFDKSRLISEIDSAGSQFSVSADLS